MGPMHQCEIKNRTRGDNEIEWATGLQYLGVHFTSAKIVDMSMQTHKFYAASNSILHNSIYVLEMSRLHLVEAYTLPLLTYTYEAVNMYAAQVHVLSVCWNNVYRRLFRMHQWESVKMLQLLSGRLTLFCMFDLRKLCFLKKVFTSSNNVLLVCGQNFYTSMKYKALCRDYDIDISQMFVSYQCLRKLVYDKCQIVVHASLR